MAPRPCLDCGALANGTRCPSCSRARQRARNRRRPWYRGDWRATAQRIRAEWIEQHGLWCPGWGDEPAHHVAHVTDLQVDHVANRSRAAGLTVMCARHNAQKR